MTKQERQEKRKKEIEKLTEKMEEYLHFMGKF